MNVEREKITVIVPVYNAEKYLDRCVKSIVEQTYKNWELILIDDGSIDGSGQLCDNWAEKDGRIKVIHKQNEGVSAARNNGISISSGEYITFIDSDDYWKKDFLMTLYHHMNDSKVDIVVCNFETDYEENVQKRSYNLIEQEECIVDVNRLFRDCTEHKIYTYLIWGKLYRSTLIKGMKFSGQAYSEDALFIREIFRKEPCVKLIPYIGYYYYINNSSVTNNISRRMEKNFKKNGKNTGWT